MRIGFQMIDAAALSLSHSSTKICFFVSTPFVVLLILHECEYISNLVQHHSLRQTRFCWLDDWTRMLFLALFLHKSSKHDTNAYHQGSEQRDALLLSLKINPCADSNPGPFPMETNVQLLSCNYANATDNYTETANTVIVYMDSWCGIKIKASVKMVWRSHGHLGVSCRLRMAAPVRISWLYRNTLWTNFAMYERMHAAQLVDEPRTPKKGGGEGAEGRKRRRGTGRRRRRGRMRRAASRKPILVIIMQVGIIRLLTI